MSVPDYPDFPNELTPIGSSYYYPIRFAPVTRQPGLGLVTALYRTLRAIPRECTDPVVGLKKLEWWQSQLLTDNIDSPTRHPLINRLHQTAPQIFGQRESLQRLLSEMEHELRAQPLDSEEELQRHQKATGGVFLRLLTLLSDGNAEQQDLAETMGHFFAIVETARNLGLDARRGSILLPASRLREQAINRHNLFDRKSQIKLQALLEQLIGASRETVLQELTALKPGIG
jgi:phytoene synthase